jgi:hypothetical protein
MSDASGSEAGTGGHESSGLTAHLTYIDLVTSDLHCRCNPESLNMIAINLFRFPVKPEVRPAQVL